jgi:pimeloyl-ACP methyl ester carboxylesterase
MDIDVHGARLHYDVLGAGEPLLWLHGFSGAGSDWKYVVDEPPAGFQLIAPDLRGHGASTNPSRAFTFRRAALDTLALLRHLGVERVKAIGLSGGGITLLHMATLAPVSISAMVVISAPPYFPEQARAIQRQFSGAMLSAEEMARMRQRHTFGEPQIQQLFAHARGFADSYDDVSFTRPSLARITADTLIVFGDRDPLYPVSLAFELRDAIPRSYLWVVPNGGHGPIFGEAAPAFRATALSFLRGEWAGAKE